MSSADVDRDRARRAVQRLLAATCHDHVEAVAAVLAAFGKRARAGIDRADKLGDDDTADLFTEISQGVDKWLWFVDAHLQADR